MIHSLSPAVLGRDTTTISRRRWLAAGGASVVTSLVGCNRNDSGEPGAQAPRPSPLKSALDWFASARQDDGAWHSSHYAQLRDGTALTPLIYLGVKPHTQAPSGRDRYLSLLIHSRKFIRNSVSAAGVIGLRDPELPEYPNYATSLALLCLVVDGYAEDGPRIAQMAAYLVAQQYNEASGFAPDHPAYGGWGFGGPNPVGESPGHMDLSHTRHVLQALRAAGHDDPQTYARAEKFMRLLQKQGTPGFDGGFYFSPIVFAANKGGEETIDGQTYFRSYATATCDGILALLACGVKPDDERITSAVDWLKKHPRLDYPEGVLEGTDTNWGASIRYYHFAVRAECYRALDWPGDWRGELRTMLAKLQQPDGSFVNREGFLMKEDDPILCTALAVIALSQ